MKRHGEMLRAGVPGIANLKAYFYDKWGSNLIAVRKAGGHQALRNMYRNHRRMTAKAVTQENLQRLETVDAVRNRTMTQRIMGRVRSVGNKLRSYITKGN